MSDHLSDVGQSQQRVPSFRPSDVVETAICSGASFGIYVLRELIGIGHTASVYRAHDTRLLREVALKVLNTEVLRGADGLARFLHEARMAAAIRHPNVVSMFDVGAHDGKPYIVMELLTGEDLDVRLNTTRVLREGVLIDMAVQLVSGLGAVHDAGVVHRDVRPGNVFLARGPDGSIQPKLLDFGGSKQARDYGRLTTNGRRRWAAMPLYTAPEVLLGAEATFLSDQYSLGVSLYECATGVHPFRADNVRESVELITAGQARRISDQPLQPSRRLAAIIERAMHFDPSERFADVGELGAALASARGRRLWPWGAGPEPALARASASAAGTKAWQAPPEASERSDRRLGWAIGAAVIACSIGAPVWAWWSVRRPRAPAAVTVTAPLVSSAAPVPLDGTCAPGPISHVLASPPAAALSAPAEALTPAALTPAVLPPAAAVLPPAALPLPQVPVPHTLVQTAPPARPAAAPAIEAAVAPPLAESVASGAVGGDGLADEVPAPAAPALEGDSLLGDSVLADPVDPSAAALDGGVDARAPSEVAAPSGPERGTNGALIFD